ncbi:MAG: glycosyltransferase family 2 protein [Phycisphaerales bacterium]|nr:MAG: glycosyltransferase family 2 protein [Phycisphaerales bacterium]
MSELHIGVVTPVYNEQECLGQFRDRLCAVLNDTDCRYDVYLIDDGSDDDTPEIIRQFAQEDRRWHGVFLARNFGHQAAITAGLECARGKVIIVMDGDLQDEPESIPKMLEQWQNGYDTVYAVRTNRKESVLHRLAYWTFYRLLNGMSPYELPLDAGDFCLMSRKVVDTINALPESGRFVRGLRAWVGYRQIGIETERNPRAAGKPKYTVGKLFRLATDGIMDFSWVPLRAVSTAGLLSIVAAFGYLAVIVVMNLLGRIEVAGWTTVVFLVIWFGGMILMSLGVIGEYLGRTFAEVKRRPAYVVARTTDEPTSNACMLEARTVAADRAVAGKFGARGAEPADARVAICEEEAASR